MSSLALLLKWCQTSTRLDTTLIPTQQHAKGYAYDAERKMGEMLAATERADGGQPYQAHPTGIVLLPVEHEPTLAELGITKRESSDAQRLAELPWRHPRSLALMATEQGVVSVEFHRAKISHTNKST